VKIKLSTYKTQTAAFPDHYLTASITRTVQKLRIFAITVTTMAVCQFLGQWFDLGNGPKYAVFPYT
jgi:hypothetical protein